MPLYALDGIAPEIAPDAYVAPTAVLIGRVRLKKGASVWWNAVLRGDNEWIELGEGSNVQDGTVCHTDPGAPLTLGEGVTVGHAAILHGCTVGNGALIGMGAVVLNHATVGDEALVGARALVAEHKEIPARSLALGAPAKVVRTLSDDDVARMRGGAERYVANGARYAAGCIETR
ncbi:MAG: gamma carbonic anhydrase family protein [Pseudomonadota bacterium]